MNPRIKEFHHIIRASDPYASFQEQLVEVLDKLILLSEDRKLFFVRFFISDAANQQESLLAAMKERGIVQASIIQQPPLDGSKISAWAWIIDGELNPAYVHKVTYGLSNDTPGSLGQMENIFSEYEKQMEEDDMKVADNCVRTWIFVRDVDTNYAGVVTGRRNYFEKIGLTPDTHYIASTGIQGAHPDWRKVVVMDAYAVKGLRPEQICFLQAKDHLNPTYEYGVTFERGTSITYGDRKHIFISGTASINNKGMILHEGDVRKQAIRMMENISALLAEAGAGIDDIKSSILYLRDSADYAAISELFNKQWPMIDPVFVQAPVCRPGWLIEVECIATSQEGDLKYPAL
jgi:enamine deaminase RidA (YjgF/YER057c/UK114 family)